MKPQHKSRVQLRRETVKTLTSQHLQAVTGGGQIPNVSQDPNRPDQCPIGSGTGTGHVIGPSGLIGGGLIGGGGLSPIIGGGWRP